MQLEGKVAIVTGAARGIGRGIAERFVEQGARVVIADVIGDEGAALAEQLGPSARFLATDVSERAAVQALVDFTVETFGGLDAIVNNAGVTDNATMPLLDDGFDRFEPVTRVNLLGVMLGTQIAGRHMAQAGGGAILNVASIGGITAGFGFPIYRAVKAGVIAFCRSAAIELGGFDIRVNCICPGNVPTGLGTYAAPGAGMDEAAFREMQAEIRSARLKLQPLKRTATPQDIADAAVFLASDAARQITGQVLSIDGGATAGDASNLIGEIASIRRRFNA